MTRTTARTFCIAIALIGTLSVQGQLSGSYSIGGTSPDYATLTDAVNNLQNEGISGPVTFNVRNGTYHEEVDFQLVQGASATNTITFQSESGDSSQVIFENVSDGLSSNFDFDDAAHYIMRGITFHNANPADYWEVVGIHGECADLTFENCRFTSAYALEDYLLYGDFDLLDGITIANCSFGISYQAIYLHGSDSGKDITIRNNYFDRTSYGIEFNEVHNITIKHNHMPDVEEYGMELDDINGAVIIENNYVNLTHREYDGYGIFLYDSDRPLSSLSIRNNHVIGNEDYEGLFLFELTLSGQNSGIVANNMVAGFDFVLRLEYLENVIFAHNALYAFEENHHTVYTNSNDNLTFKNNIIAHDISGTQDVMYIDDTAALGDADNNVFHVTGNDISSYGATLADHQSATGTDANSVSMDPQFWDGAAGDLRVCNGSLRELGEGLATIAADKYGQSRDGSAPTPGAMELLYSYTDARADFTIQRNGLEVTFVNETENLADFTWHFGDNDSSTADNPVHTYASGGSYEVTLEANSACGSDEATLTFDVWPTGIDNQALNQHLRLAPNPTKGQVNIISSGGNVSNASLKVMTVDGRTVMSRQVELTSDLQLDFSELSSGLYLVRIHSDEGAGTWKVVKE